MWAGSVVMDGENENIVLFGRQAKEYDIWALQHLGRYVGERCYKLNEVADIARGKHPRSSKENHNKLVCNELHSVQTRDRKYWKERLRVNTTSMGIPKRGTSTGLDRKETAILAHDC